AAGNFLLFFIKIWYTIDAFSFPVTKALNNPLD
ncbi:unnamed protein product, partial [marine sediment metagenome]